jgi:two-component system, LuxR family, response regulator FixJ
MMIQRKPPMIHLVIDDEAVRDSLRLLLECEGFAVRDFASPETFLARDSREDGDCLILDIHEASRNAVEMLEKLRQQGYALPAIMVTSWSGPGLAARALSCGALAVLEKPVPFPVIVTLIRTALTRGQNSAHGSDPD